MLQQELSIAGITETGSLGIMHLRHFWSRIIATRNGQASAKDFTHYYDLDSALLSVLRLSVEPVTRYLYHENPTFDQFERWIIDSTGNMPRPEWVELFNQNVEKEDNSHAWRPPSEDLLTDEDWAFWNTNGYLIIRNAVSPDDCRKTTNLICSHLGIDLHDPATWYNSHNDRQGIMIQLFHHEQLEKNRLSARIRRVFEQLWQRNDILPSADRVSFNPPETKSFPFQGPDLHWDVSLQQPIPFGTQGLLYLTDTAANQGAFTLVPGFQHRVADWMSSLPEGKNPRQENLHALGSLPIAANAGDFIVWHQALPHGSSPNTSSVPRIVQYINYQPVRVEIQPEWI